MSTNKKVARSRVSGYKGPSLNIPRSILEPGADFKWSRDVVFDLHNTLVDWTGPFVRHVNNTHGFKIDAKSIGLYHMQFDPDNPMTDEQFLADFVNFARKAVDGYGDLPFYKESVATLKTLKEAGLNPKIWTWTPGASDTRLDSNAAGFHYGVAQGVTKALVERLGLNATRDLRFMRPGEKKYNMISNHIPLIVEDSSETAVGVGQMGNVALLVPQPYNIGITAPNVVCLDNLSQVGPAVIEFYSELAARDLLL